MANMSYCRFRNTLRDLQDCRDAMFDILSREEDQARMYLIREMAHMLAELGVRIDGQQIKDAEEQLEALCEDA